MIMYRIHFPLVLLANLPPTPTHPYTYTQLHTPTPTHTHVTWSPRCGAAWPAFLGISLVCVYVVVALFTSFHANVLFGKYQKRFRHIPHSYSITYVAIFCSAAGEVSCHLAEAPTQFVCAAAVRLQTAYFILRSMWQALSRMDLAVH